ncbi:MAG: HAD family hydrolase [Planctomycetes bacterium]|nr:HAD family hydrolase [Planctomycetota bacterium]
MRFVDRFDVLLLDMGNTFMFGCDRFSEDVAATYAALGGRALSAAQVRGAIDALHAGLLALGRSGDRDDSFPRVGEHLADLPATRGLPAAERDLLAQTFALHEVGTIGPFHADVLRRLAETHRLGVISNVWSDSWVFAAEFRRAGIDGLFDTVVFSSDHGSIKPSLRLFDRAVEAMACERSRVVYIGDSLSRDVAGAAGAGIASVWVNASGASRPGDAPRPDLEIRCLSELLKDGPRTQSGGR